LAAEKRLRDRDVRQAVHDAVAADHAQAPDTMILHEFGLRHGMARVDVVAVNGAIHGYEIKSDADTLHRLPQQVSIYGEVLDFASIVVGQRHVQPMRQHVPDWWGITIVHSRAGCVRLERERVASVNPLQIPTSVAELLWHSEAADILRARGAPAALLRRPRSALYEALAAELGLAGLRDEVRTALKARQNWRAHPQRGPNDG